MAASTLQLIRPTAEGENPLHAGAMRLLRLAAVYCGIALVGAIVAAIISLGAHVSVVRALGGFVLGLIPIVAFLLLLHNVTLLFDLLSWRSEIRSRPGPSKLSLEQVRRHHRRQFLLRLTVSPLIAVLLAITLWWWSVARNDSTFTRGLMIGLSISAIFMTVFRTLIRYQHLRNVQRYSEEHTPADD